MSDKSKAKKILKDFVSEDGKNDAKLLKKVLKRDIKSDRKK